VQRAWLLLLIGLLVGLPLCAHLSPPDPTWIGGFYDDGDHDDAVLAVTGMAAVADEGGPIVALPLPRAPWTVGEPSEGLPGPVVPAAHRTRAPPTV
jgi:hypothetical protein